MHQDRTVLVEDYPQIRRLWREFGSVAYVARNQGISEQQVLEICLAEPGGSCGVTVQHTDSDGSVRGPMSFTDQDLLLGWITLAVNVATAPFCLRFTPDVSASSNKQPPPAPGHKNEPEGGS